MHLRHIGRCALLTRLVTQHISSFGTFEVRISFPVFLASYTRDLKHDIFPNWKAQRLQPGKVGGGGGGGGGGGRGRIVIIMVFRPTAERPKSGLA